MTFGTSPVKHCWDAYWALNGAIDDFCDRRDHHLQAEYGSAEPVRFLISEEPEDSAKMVFKRYPNLLSDTESVDEIMVGYLLQLCSSPKFVYKPPMGEHQRHSNNVILNDSWVVNLISSQENCGWVTKQEDTYPMESFLTGLSQEIKDAWKQSEHERPTVNLNAEMNELLQVYENTLKTLNDRHASRESALVYEMEKFCAVHKERKEMLKKYGSLKAKLSCTDPHAPCCMGDPDGDDE